MIYVEATIRVAPDKVEEFKKLLEKHLPLAEKYGRKLVGSWETLIGPRIPRQIVNLWAFEDMAHRERYNAVFSKDEELLKSRSRLESLILEETTKIMVPTPYSPLK